MPIIQYLTPIAGISSKEQQRRQMTLNTYLSNPLNRVVVDTLENGPKSLECSIDTDISIHSILRIALTKNHSYDAFVIGCVKDPGLFSLRELLDVPVVGPLEASIAFSSMIGDKYTIIITTEEGVPETRMILRKYGALEKCASIRHLDHSVTEMLSGEVSKENITDRFANEVNLAAKDGAAVIIMGCMMMAWLQLDDAVKEATHLPVINPAKIAIKTAEMMISLGMRHSDAAYPKPGIDKVKLSIL